jgi:hypothetical protein
LELSHGLDSVRLSEFPGLDLSRFRKEPAMEFRFLQLGSFSHEESVVDVARSQKGGIERVHIVRRHDKDYIVWCVKSVQDVEQPESVTPPRSALAFCASAAKSGVCFWPAASCRRFPAFMQSMSSRRMTEFSGTEFIAFFSVRSFSSVKLTT